MPQNSPKDHKAPRRKSGPPRSDKPRRPEQQAERSRPPKGEGREPGGAERIAKVMARAGACSRRDAESWIEDGRVAVNGEVLHDPAFNVGEDDTITIDGTPLPRRTRTRLFRFYKPRGLVTTEHDPEGRPTIFDHLREHWPQGPRVVSVGRLDINTEGLMLLTNDGGLARVLELPSTGWVRRYRVRVNGETDQARLDSLRRGIEVDGVSYAGIEATLDRVQGANCWLTMSLREGKNREIKRVLEHIGLAVNRLIRISFGPFQLGELAEGTVEEIRTRVLRDQIGPSLAKAAGADFTSPLADEPERPARPVEAPRQRPGRAPGPGRRPSDAGRSPRASRSAVATAAEAATAPKLKPPVRVRKHVSVLRRQDAQAATATGEPRKRIERAETADRNGRVVSVERVVAVAAKPVEASTKTRNGRRLAALRKNGPDAPEHRARAPSTKRPRAAGPRPETTRDRRPADGLPRPHESTSHRADARRTNSRPNNGGQKSGSFAKGAKPRGEPQGAGRNHNEGRGHGPRQGAQASRPPRGAGGHGKHGPKSPRNVR